MEQRTPGGERPLKAGALPSTKLKDLRIGACAFVPMGMEGAGFFSLASLWLSAERYRLQLAAWPISIRQAVNEITDAIVVNKIVPEVTTASRL